MWNTVITTYGYPGYHSKWEKKVDDDCETFTKYFQDLLKKTNRLVDYEFSYEDDGNVQVFTKDLPGVKKEDVSLEVIDEQKLLLTTKRDEKETALNVFPSREYDVNTATAKLELGVLEIRFTKKVVAKKTIEVK